jgi:hypothetical protein
LTTITDTKKTNARAEMKARVIRWSNTCNKLSDEIAEWSVTSRNPNVALQIAEQVSQVALQLISAQAWGDVFVEPSPGKRADDGRQWAQGQRERKN